MRQEFITRLTKARAELTAVQERELVMQLARRDVRGHLDGYVAAHRKRIAATLENWWDKYAMPLCEIEADCDTSATRLAGFLRGLGYE